MMRTSTKVYALNGFSLLCSLKREVSSHYIKNISEGNKKLTNINSGNCSANKEN